MMRRRNRMVEQTIAWRLTRMRRQRWLQQLHAYLGMQHTENLAIEYGHLFPDLISAG